MFKQFIHSDNSKSELEYVNDVWSEKWDQKQVDADIEYLGSTDYFSILKKYLKPSMRLLEAGCGQAQWVRYYKNLGYQITGVDISEATLNKIKAKYPDINLVTADVFKLPFADSSFDAYLSFGVIEHFEQGPKDILIEAKRVLKPEGLLCVSVPYMNALKKAQWKNRQDNSQDFPQNTPIRFYQYVMSKEELKSAVEEAGFEVLTIAPTDSGHTLKTRSTLATNIAAKTKINNPLVQWIRPWLRKAWHFYVKSQSQDRSAHMIFAICRNRK